MQETTVYLKGDVSAGESQGGTGEESASYRKQERRNEAPAKEDAQDELETEKAVERVVCKERKTRFP